MSRKVWKDLPGALTSSAAPLPVHGMEEYSTSCSACPDVFYCTVMFGKAGLLLEATGAPGSSIEATHFASPVFLAWTSSVFALFGLALVEAAVVSRVCWF